MNSAPAVKGFDLMPQARAQASELGRTFGVSPSLDECDHILAHLIVSRGNIENAVARYFQGGRQDADQILSLIGHLGLGPDAAVLDFACGYGRISRHLGAINLTCCDIHDAAVAFAARELGQRAFLSTFVPEEIAFPHKFDLIFVVSLFSHLPDALFGRWLAALTD